MFRFSAALALLLTLSPGVHADDRAAQVEAGRDIADRLCARCHAIEADDESLHEQAPPLRTFARKWPLENLEEALAEGIVVGHPDMPEFVLDPDEIASFIAYLESLE